MLLERPPVDVGAGVVLGEDRLQYFDALEAGLIAAVVAVLVCVTLLVVLVAVLVGMRGARGIVVSWRWNLPIGEGLSCHLGSCHVQRGDVEFVSPHHLDVTAPACRTAHRPPRLDL